MTVSYSGDVANASRFGIFIKVDFLIYDNLIYDFCK